MRRAIALAALAAISLPTAACRDGVAPFAPPALVRGDSALLQLTFNTGHERDPQWTPDGHTLYYYADTWFGAPALPGVLLQLPSEGGIAQRLAPQAQPNATIRLLLPVPSPVGQRIAYLQLARLRTPMMCRLGADPCPLPAALLDSGVVRVRDLEALGSVHDDVGAGIFYPGATRAIEEPFEEQLHQYDLDYQQEGHATSLRPSWSPDGQQIVYSDGTRLLRWQVGAAQAVPIPGSEHGVAPAWSPDGQFIAFGILLPGASRVFSCDCGSAEYPLPITREGWDLAARLVAVIRPDGSGLRIVTEGSEPSWSPDAQTLYFRREESGVYRIGLAEGAAAQRLDGTEGARSPAVSPDGSALAFSRRGPRGDFNIWRLELDP